MPPDLPSVTGLAAASPSPDAQTGSGQPGPYGQSPTGRYPALRQSILAVQAALDEIRDHLANPDRSLDFEGDPATGLVTVSVKNAQTGELIRQIPGDAILRFADALTVRDAGHQALVDLTA